MNQGKYLIDRGAVLQKAYFLYGVFDDLDLNFRKTCNKIIHSDVMEPHYNA